jgi:beta-1,4-N-acetylglucosaminyltransferase
VARDEKNISCGSLCGKVKMIFVTAAGSTLPFNELVKKIDMLIAKREIKEKVIIQIGNGNYIPKNCKWFRFEKDLEKYYKKASLVITHSGGGTLFELVNWEKKVICMVNPGAVNNPDIVIKLSSENYILWCKNLEEMKSSIEKAKKFKFKKYKSPKCEIDKIIKDFLRK